MGIPSLSYTLKCCNVNPVRQNTQEIRVRHIVTEFSDNSYKT